LHIQVVKEQAMKRTLVRALQSFAMASALWGGAAHAQELPSSRGAFLAAPQSAPPPTSVIIPVTNTVPAPTTIPANNPAPQYQESWAPSNSLLDVPWGDGEGGVLDRLYTGADFLLIRPTFSTAIAFVRTNAGAANGGFFQQVNASELNFDYQAAFRVFCGYQLDGCTALQFTYSYIDTNTNVNGAVAANQLAQTIVDPFGNVAKPGESILTRAVVRMNVYDIDLIRTIAFNKMNVDVNLTAGARIVDLDQVYRAQIFGAAGNLASQGDFTQTFVGAGPRLGLGADWWLGAHKHLALYVKSDLAFLLGSLDINTTVTLPGLSGQQTASRTRLLPVFETELGVAWQPLPSLTISAGWLFQAWFDLGTAGGTFGGQFTETHDSNIMSFDGLAVRAKVTF
jgi:hypothetical protein